ncbi:type II toxin-antitoxin system VapC family toxin [Luteococcus sp. H138]|uniref:type II toxin-antitoxin system VapC family toxin n=1 Tax=unclassified Luteococcus TaxID=2639923 RepID=UPI00313C8234
MTTYLDTSAAMKAIIAEPESNALRQTVDDLADTDDELVSSWLLHTELHCAATRRAEIPAAFVGQLLADVSLVDITREHLVIGASARWGLEAGDAIHVATALFLGVDQIITYDREMIDVLCRIGIPVLSPGA